MKKNVLMLILLVVSTFSIGLDLVKANDSSYNGGAGTSTSVPGDSPEGCDVEWVQNCVWNNGSHITSRVTLYYFSETGARTMIGRPVYIANSNAKARFESDRWGFTKENGWNIVYEDSLNRGLSSRTHNYSYFIELFTGSTTGVKVKKDVLERYLLEMNTSIEQLTNLSQPSSETTPANYGYRLIIEPAYSVAFDDRNVNGVQLYKTLKTAKEIAASGGFSNNSHFISSGNAGVADASVNMWVKWRDVGISGLGRTQPGGITVLDTIANFNSGYAMGIIDISDAVVQNQCYNISVEGVVARCENTGKVNNGFVYEKVNGPFVCPNNIPDESIGEYGHLEIQTNDYKVYCTETAQQAFPGNFKDRVKLGTHLEWPTNSSSLNNNYFLTIRGTKTCKIIGNFNAYTADYVANQILIDYQGEFKSDTTVSWNDGSGRITLVDLWGSAKNYKSVSGDTITINRTVNFSLPDNFNRYVNKKTGEVSNTPPSDDYVDIGYANLSVSKDAVVGDYQLKVINSTLGSANLFGTLIENQNYTCYYEIGDNNNDCLCPEGSDNAGESIYDLIVKEGLSCAEGQQKYCNSCLCPENSDMPNLDIYNRVQSEGISCAEGRQKYCYTAVCVTCPPGTLNEGIEIDCNGNCEEAKQNLCNKSILDVDDYCYTGDLKYCPEPYSDTEITSCINAGMSYNECVSKLCPSGTYKCRNTNGVGGYMDITSCVQTKVGQGKTLQEAIDECDSIICPLNGMTIVYRTISLVNPFPSYNADKTVTQTGLNIGMFNDTVKGRYPGSNWNSTTIVKNKILNNRNVDGDDVYQKEPLYTFVLNSENIKAIRDYNKNQNDGYSDFNLDCLTNNSIACVSSFVHNRTYGLTGGTCDKRLTSSNFYTCDD